MEMLIPEKVFRWCHNDVLIVEMSEKTIFAVLDVFSISY